ncbi:hypothetical protein [Aeoliella sp. SH292]|uniref:hypothetical protein n=1 Tax=Aeoliella sp. SH292 TaxID=3454464 RepID=UPI003F9AC6D2
MPTLKHYEDLPDNVTCAELVKEFHTLLAEPQGMSPLDLSDALFELASRQWNTFEHLSDEMKQMASAKVIEWWSDSDTRRAEALLGAIARLGLGDTLRLLQARDISRMSDEVRQSLVEASSEFGETVDDPYSGLDV